jgi:hypothetical protein
MLLMPHQPPFGPRIGLAEHTGLFDLARNLAEVEKVDKICVRDGPGWWPWIPSPGVMFSRNDVSEPALRWMVTAPSDGDRNETGNLPVVHRMASSFSAVYSTTASRKLLGL